jgi:hypothetical protein
VHVHKAHGGAVDRRGNKMPYLGTLPNDSKYNEAGFSTISIDLLCLRVAQEPRSQDLANFCADDRQTTDR